MTPYWDRPPSSSACSSGLTDSDRHRLFAAERRRIALELLEEADLPFALEELATAITDRETELGTREADAPDAGDVERVAISLHHVHLPLMADLGVVDYDAASKRVDAFRVPEKLSPR